MPLVMCEKLDKQTVRRCMDALSAYVRRTNLFRDHAGAAFL